MYHPEGNQIDLADLAMVVGSAHFLSPPLTQMVLHTCTVKL